MTATLATSIVPGRVSSYVPNCKYDAEVVHAGPFTADLGAPVALDADGILDGQSIASASNTSTFASTYSEDNMSEYGRCVSVVSDGAATSTVTVDGRDWLGQAMTETLTLAGTTTVNGNKAFKVIEKISWTATASRTVDVGWTDRLGIPFKMDAAVGAEEDNAGTIIATDPGSRNYRAESANVTSLNTGSATFTVNAPINGYLIGISGSVTTAVTTAAALMDCTVAGVGVAAMDVTVPVSGVGAAFGVPVQPEADWVTVAHGTTCIWTSDNGPGAGAADFTAWFGLKNCEVVEGTNVTQTATTTDTRGLYIPLTAFNGTINHKLTYLPDRDNLHGNAQFRAT